MEKDLFIELRLYPELDDDLILLYNNGFPLRKYLFSILNYYIEGKSIPKTIDWEAYSHVDGVKLSKKELHIRIQIPPSETKIYDLFLNGVQKSRRNGFCKALLRSAIIYYINEPIEVEKYEFRVDFIKNYDLDLISLASNFDIKKMIYDVLENVALMYFGNEEVEPIHFLIDEYNVDKNVDELKGFSLNFSVLSNSAIANLLDLIPLNASQYCKNVLRSCIITQNLSCYLHEDYIDNDRNICINVDYSQYTNIRKCSDYVKDEDSISGNMRDDLLKPVRKKPYKQVKNIKHISNIVVQENNFAGQPTLSSTQELEEAANATTETIYKEETPKESETQDIVSHVQNDVYISSSENNSDNNLDTDDDIIESDDEQQRLLDMLNGAF